MMPKRLITLILLQLGLLAPGYANGSISLFLEEPYGFFGDMNPTGHAAIYLNHVCAASPLELRPCAVGESGVVISRYGGIGGYDWIAIPLVPYLYAVDSIDQVPAWVDAKGLEVLKQKYRREYLGEVAREPSGGVGEKNGWRQLIGAAYIRKIYSYRIETPSDDDEAFIREFNAKENKSHFNLFFNNCADFSRTILNFYYPGAVRRSVTADLGLTTPKQVAKSLSRYSHQHESLEFSAFVIPQIPGTLPRSHVPHGITESLIKTKKYLIPMTLLQPYVAVGVAVTYLTRGRFEPGHDAQTLDIADQVRNLEDDKPNAATTAAAPISPSMSAIASARASSAIADGSPQ